MIYVNKCHLLRDKRQGSFHNENVLCWSCFVWKNYGFLTKIYSSGVRKRNNWLLGFHTEADFGPHVGSQIPFTILSPTTHWTCWGERSVLLNLRLDYVDVSHYSAMRGFYCNHHWKFSISLRSSFLLQSLNRSSTHTSKLLPCSCLWFLWHGGIITKTGKHHHWRKGLFGSH